MKILIFFICILSFSYQAKVNYILKSDLKRSVEVKYDLPDQNYEMELVNNYLHSQDQQIQQLSDQFDVKIINQPGRNSNLECEGNGIQITTREINRLQVIQKSKGILNDETQMFDGKKIRIINFTEYEKNNFMILANNCQAYYAYEEDGFLQFYQSVSFCHLIDQINDREDILILPENPIYDNSGKPLQNQKIKQILIFTKQTVISLPKINFDTIRLDSLSLDRKIFKVNGWESVYSIRKIDIANDLILCALGSNLVVIYTYDQDSFTLKKSQDFDFRILTDFNTVTDIQVDSDFKFAYILCDQKYIMRIDLLKKAVDPYFTIDESNTIGIEIVNNTLIVNTLISQSYNYIKEYRIQKIQENDGETENIFLHKVHESFIKVNNLSINKKFVIIQGSSVHKFLTHSLEVFDNNDHDVKTSNKFTSKGLKQIKFSHFNKISEDDTQGYFYGVNSNQFFVYTYKINQPKIICSLKQEDDSTIQLDNYSLKVESYSYNCNQKKNQNNIFEYCARNNTFQIQITNEPKKKNQSHGFLIPLSITIFSLLLLLIIYFLYIEIRKRKLKQELHRKQFFQSQQQETSPPKSPTSSSLNNSLLVPLQNEININ